MHNSRAYNYSRRQDEEPLRVEAAEDMNKMFTLYENVDPQSLLDLALYQHQQLLNLQLSWGDTPDSTIPTWTLPLSTSPATSCLSTFSSSSSSENESAQSSPAPGELRWMSVDEEENLVGVFNAPLDNFFTMGMLALPYPEVAGLELFPETPLSNPHSQAYIQQHHYAPLTETGVVAEQFNDMWNSAEHYPSQHHGVRHRQSLDSVLTSSPTSRGGRGPQRPRSRSMLSVASVAFSPPYPPTQTIACLSTEETGGVGSMDGITTRHHSAMDSTTYRCELCPEESFGRIHDLKRHHASKHLNTRKWSCEFCSMRFARRDALLRHYTVKSTRDDGLHPKSSEAETLKVARIKAKSIH